VTPPPYKNPVPTVDLIIELPGGKIVLIQRKNPPLGWALPGGFVDYGESLEEAALREAEEETSLKVTLVRQFHTYSRPDRDPRRHTITTVYIARAEGKPQAADDAAGIGIFDPDNPPSPLAFDHREILEEYVREKDKTTPMDRSAEETDKKIHQAVHYLKERLPFSPRIAVVLGTGLGGLAERLKDQTALAYETIPYFPCSTVESHEGRLLSGTLAGKPILVLQGRFHLYEGYTAQEIAFPIRVLAALGVKVLIISNAAGGLDPLFKAGDIMLITDQINYTGENPLIGPHLEKWGPRFPDMSQVFDPELIALARAVAKREKILLRRGVYVGLKGPSLETPAETRVLMTLGAQAVGMSTVMEVIAAVQAGMRILGISVITNVNRPERMKPSSIESIIETARKTGPKLVRLVEGIVSDLEEPAG
jgi:purine-nucleoside phosphorylase